MLLSVQTVLKCKGNVNNINVELQIFAAAKKVYFCYKTCLPSNNLFHVARCVNKSVDFIPYVCLFVRFIDIPTWRGSAIFSIRCTTILLV